MARLLSFVIIQRRSHIKTLVTTVSEKECIRICKLKLNSSGVLPFSTEGRDQTQDPSSSLQSTATLHFDSHWDTDYCVGFVISGVALGGDFSVDCAVIGFLYRPLSVSPPLPSLAIETN